MNFTYTDAILKIRPEAAFHVKDNEYDTLQWYDTIQTRPTEEEIQIQLELMKLDWENKTYQRERQMVYPPLTDLADALYWQSQGDNTKYDKYIETISQIKEKYPKV